MKRTLVVVVALLISGWALILGVLERQFVPVAVIWLIFLSALLPHASGGLARRFRELTSRPSIVVASGVMGSLLLVARAILMDEPTLLTIVYLIIVSFGTGFVFARMRRARR